MCIHVVNHLCFFIGAKVEKDIHIQKGILRSVGQVWYILHLCYCIFFDEFVSIFLN